MKRIVLLFCTVMLFICSLCGCSASPEKTFYPRREHDPRGQHREGSG